MGRQSDLPPEQRAEIVMALLRREEPSSVLARRHGVSTKTLSNWKEEFIAGGTANMASSKKQKGIEQKKLVTLEAALEERDQVIGELTVANRILKKNGCPPKSTKYSEVR